MKKNMKFLKRSICILFSILFFFEIIAFAEQPQAPEKFYGNVYINGVIAGPGHLIDARNASGSSKILAGSDPFTDENSSYGNNISAVFYVSNFSDDENKTIYFFVDNYSSNTSLYTSRMQTHLDLYVAPAFINNINPENNSINTTGNVNVTVTHDKNGTAKLNWNGVNYTMFPNTLSPAGTVFYHNFSGLLSGNYSFKVYAYDGTNLSNVSETRTITVNRTNITNLSSSVNITTGNVSQEINILAPSRNTTLTIFNGTNATLNGSTLTNICINSLNQVNTTYELAGSYKFAGENISLCPEGARFTPDLQIRINYTLDQLNASGVTESDLAVKYYNTSANAWEALTIYERNTTDHFLRANISHFSEIALIGIPPSTGCISNCGGGGGGSSGGGGGGGGSSGEKYTNIVASEKYDMQISKDVITSYRFIHAKSPIMFVNITGNTSLGIITASIEVLKDTSTLVKVSPEGLVYKNANIWVGTAGFATPKNIKEALIKFRIDNAWMSANGVLASDIVLKKWDGSKWISLETRELDKSQEFTFFEGRTNSFSPFAIVVKTQEMPGSRSITEPAAMQQTTTTQTTTTQPPTEIPEEPTAIQTGVYLMIAVVIILGVIIVTVTRMFKNRKE